jgi:hypothetical protein
LRRGGCSTPATWDPRGTIPRPWDERGSTWAEGGRSPDGRRPTGRGDLGAAAARTSPGTEGSSSTCPRTPPSSSPRLRTPNKTKNKKYYNRFEET